jgi:hypothetical protein
MWWPVDTLYTSGYLDLSDKPVILTIPNNAPIPPTSYSILMLDPYGDIFDAGIPRQPGIYSLTGSGLQARFPQRSLPSQCLSTFRV